MSNNEPHNNDVSATGESPDAHFVLSFRTVRKRNEHFQMHSPRLAQFGIIVKSPEEYELKAAQFLDSTGSNTCRQCKNRDGDTVKFDSKTDEFGLLSPDEYIKTYYIPDPYEHMAPTNSRYFQRQCVTNHEPCKQ
jgi:hypothetical protein